MSAYAELGFCLCTLRHKFMAGLLFFRVDVPSSVNIIRIIPQRGGQKLN